MHIKPGTIVDEKLTVIRQVGSWVSTYDEGRCDARTHTRFEVKCKCGNVFVVRGSYLQFGRVACCICDPPIRWVHPAPISTPISPAPLGWGWTAPSKLEQKLMRRAERRLKDEEDACQTPNGDTTPMADTN